MNIRPLRDRVLLHRIEEPVTEIGNIAIPVIAKDKSQHATVTAVGSSLIANGGETIRLGVNVGERVPVGRYAGTAVTLDVTECLIVRDDEILGVVRGVPAPMVA